MENNSRKTLLSGIKPTGRPHIGNYFGAMKQFVDLQTKYRGFYMIADYHALTTLQDADTLRRYTLDITMDYLAIGLDPEQAVIFKQSDILEHTELSWIFNCITTVPYLMRAHAYKAAEADNKEVSVGTFDYPLLMAADILLYDADVVPVGQDQKQHIEYARDTALKFHRIFGETFTLPEPLILDEVKTVSGIDGRKMSKSYGNTIGLFAEDDEIRSSVMKIATDSKGVEEPKDPQTCNVFALHKLFTPKDELSEIKRRYEQGGMGYKESKEILVESMIRFAMPLRERRKDITGSEDQVKKILAEGTGKAKEKAGEKMKTIRKLVGVDL